MVEPLVGRHACGSPFISIQPGYHSHHINRSGNAKMVQMRFVETDITGTAHAEGAHSDVEIVASMPERAAYCLVNVSVVWRWRAACKAWYCSCGRTVNNLRG